MEQTSTRYKRFTSSQQAALKLQLALEGFADMDEPQEHRYAYAVYLKKRWRPAVYEAAKGRKKELFRQMAAEGIVPMEKLDLLLRETAEKGETDIWLGIMMFREMLPTGPDCCIHAESPMSPEGCIRWCRNTIWRQYPYLSRLLVLLVPQSCDRCLSMGTDGEYLYYQETWLTEAWKKNKGQILHMYLHTLLHCVWLHVWDIDPSDTAGQEKADEKIEEMILREAQRGSVIGEYISSAGEEILLHDDHRFWSGPDKIHDALKPSVLRKRWEKSAAEAVRDAESMGMGKGMGSSQTSGMGNGGGSGIGLLPGSDRLLLDKIQKSRSDYRHFLSAFTVWKEMQEMDPENFDYIYYHLGMERYDRTPFIEPLEYREGNRLEQLVIAIDTSGSVKDETVRRFLEETCAILGEKENFFDRMEVWILQCDLVIEHAEKITCRRD